MTKFEKWLCGRDSDITVCTNLRNLEHLGFEFGIGVFGFRIPIFRRNLKKSQNQVWEWWNLKNRSVGETVGSQFVWIWEVWEIWDSNFSFQFSDFSSVFCFQILFFFWFLFSDFDHSFSVFGFEITVCTDLRNLWFEFGILVFSYRISALRCKFSIRFPYPGCRFSVSVLGVFRFRFSFLWIIYDHSLTRKMEHLCMGMRKLDKW